MNYAQQMKHPNWQKKRLEVLELNRFECSNCGDKEKELHVHHPFYKRGAMIWQYETVELQCLCSVCHKEAHELDERIKKALSFSDYSDKHMILGYIEALHGNTPLFPNSYEYCMGVIDFLSYLELPSRDRNHLDDDMVNWILNNKGKDAQFFAENKQSL